MDLFAAAAEARERAYAPFSHYSVGAAILGEDGQVYTGCNIENISFGATMCAERTAIFKMVSAGCHIWKSAVVVTQDGGTPCGMCLQVMAEFAPKDEQARVAWATPEGIVGEAKFHELLPSRFQSENVRKGEP